MCTTYRVYYYCGHLKRTTYIEHSGIECTQNHSKRTVEDDKCPRCIVRESRRDGRLGAILDGDEVPVIVEGEERAYDVGNELSISKQEALYGDIRAQAKGKMGEVEYRNFEGMACDCNGCSWVDAAPVKHQSTRSGGSKELLGHAGDGHVPEHHTTEKSELQRLEEQDWKCFGTGPNCSKCVRVRGKEHTTKIPHTRGGRQRPFIGGTGLDGGYRECGKKDCKCALCGFEKAVVEERAGQ